MRCDVLRGMRVVKQLGQWAPRHRRWISVGHQHQLHGHGPHRSVDGRETPPQHRTREIVENDLRRGSGRETVVERITPRTHANAKTHAQKHTHTHINEKGRAKENNRTSPGLGDSTDTVTSVGEGGSGGRRARSFFTFLFPDKKREGGIGGKNGQPCNRNSSLLLAVAEKKPVPSTRIEYPPGDRCGPGTHQICIY